MYRDLQHFRNYPHHLQNLPNERIDQQMHIQVKRLFLLDLTTHQVIHLIVQKSLILHIIQDLLVLLHILVHLIHHISLDQHAHLIIHLIIHLLLHIMVQLIHLITIQV